MHLTMYKVGFGDCFKFEETTTETKISDNGIFECEKQITHKMLVDCGNKNADLPVYGKFDNFVDFVYRDIFASPNNIQVKRYACMF